MSKIFLLVFFFINLFAHQTGLSYIQITEHQDKTIDVIYKKPLADLNANPIKINYPHRCKIISKQNRQIINGFIIQKYSLWCSKKGLWHSRIWVEGLLKQNRGISIEYKSPSIKKKALLKSTTPFIYIDDKKSTWSFVKEYIKLGIYHILSGYDHLLFVLSMLILANSRKSLLLAVTAFTLSHSVTLALAMFDVVNISTRFVESMIALSIIFLAREITMPEITLTKKHLEFIAFIFGLLHGLGFSNALKEIGLPKEDMIISLVSFNFGIELGQLIFISFAVSVFYMINKVITVRFHKLKPYLSLLIGSVAMFWFIQRVI
jgi:hydrogenase/urease accessory protein HupE